jgi:murein L,D-transpeptidase YcbB/YkuD
MSGLVFAVLGACYAAQAAAPPRPDSRAGTDTVAVTLNLPAYRLDVRAGESTHSYRVAIGARRYPTPRGSFLLRSVELNPAWIPPPSDWARDRVPMPPGPRNPMGRAKLEFLPTYYLHGTPEPESVGSAASHGCVRMRNADVLELAARVLAWGREGLDDTTRVSWLADPVTQRRIVLDRPISLEVRYDLVEVRAGRVEVHRDPYALRSDSTDAAAHAQLTEQLAPRAIPPGFASTLLDRAREGSFTISADSVSAGLLPDRGRTPDE